VAIVLISIAFAIGAKVVTGALGGFNEEVSTTSSKAKAMEAAERIAADVRAARSAGREGTALVDIADLRDAIDTDGELRDIDGTLLDWRDVTRADGNVLVMQSDVIDDPSNKPECITWEIVGSTTWHVQRTVRAYTSRCATNGAVLESDQMSEPVAATAVPVPGSGGTQPLFRYQVAEQQRGLPGCTNSLRSGPLSSAIMNRIVAVRISFSSLTTARDAASITELETEISLRSRNGSDYQYAMRCDA
jgi:hypothetical protein